MRLYSFQDQQAVDAINSLGDNTMMFSDYSKSHLYNNGGVNQNMIFEAYRWMAEKLAQKTDIYMDTEHGKIPPLPWWAWYKVDGKCEEPSEEYEMTTWGREDLKRVKTYLLTLDVPDEIVLLSDINAFYNCLQGQPCFDYLSEDEEEKAKEEFFDKVHMFMATHDKQLGEELEKLVYDSWENIFIVDGSRRLKRIDTDLPFMPTIDEKYDVQAAFPIMMKRFVRDMKVIYE